jgi:hypothetical protein
VVLVISDMEDVMGNLSKTIHPCLTEDRKQKEMINLSTLFGNMNMEERGQWGLI